jgi:hypothetical protein
VHPALHHYYLVRHCSKVSPTEVSRLFTGNGILLVKLSAVIWRASTSKVVAGVPDIDPFEEEEARKKMDELFKDENSGINFDAYEEIPVEVSGKDCPKPITSFADVSHYHSRKLYFSVSDKNRGAIENTCGAAITQKNFLCLIHFGPPPPPPSSSPSGPSSFEIGKDSDLDVVLALS